MLDLLVTRHDTKQALTSAIADCELVVHYQPIVDTADGQVRGIEALVRWQRPGHGMVPPLDFLSLAEEFGLMPEIDLFVLREACHQVQRWNSHRPADAQYCVHVNMSPVTLATPEIVGQVAAALQDSGLPPRQLTVELTESTLMADPRAVIARMQALRRTGVRLAIDDFGTGYSSLAYLRDLPVDTVKVDKSFVDGIVGAEIDRELIKTIISLASRLGLDTVAEGVEGEEQAALLSSIGCSRMQGFLFARPMPADQVEAACERVGRDARRLAHAALSPAAGIMPAPR
jgi:EAL domain-containing protein (putative c-di-GMP-specific phosphodiesterase class I)